MSAIRNILEGHIKSENGDVRKGQERFAKQLSDLIREGKVTVNNVSIRELFDLLVDYNRDVNLSKARAISEAIASSQFPTITGELISPVVLSAYELAMGDVTQLVTEISMTHSSEKLAGFTDPESLELVLELSPYEETAVGEKYVELFAHKFGRIISLSAEAILFDQTGQIMDRARRVGEAAGMHRAKYIVQKTADLACSADGEAANHSLYYNGSAVTVFSDDHSAIDGVTNDNQITTALSAAGIDAALGLLRRMKNTNGDFITVNPRFILVPPELEGTARRLLQSDLQFDLANSNATANNIYKNAFTVITSGYLTDANDWFIGDFPRQMYWGWVWKPKVETQTSTSEKAFENDIVQRFKVSYYGGANAVDYRYVVKASVS